MLHSVYFIHKFMNTTNFKEEVVFSLLVSNFCRNVDKNDIISSFMREAFSASLFAVAK